MGQQRIEAKAAPAALLAASACALAALAAFALALPAAASAEQPAFWKSCETGSGAGECLGPRGIGVDPSLPGHLYVADAGNDRIVEFSAWGRVRQGLGLGGARRLGRASDLRPRGNSPQRQLPASGRKGV